MIKLTDEQKKTFYSLGNFNTYQFRFADIDLTIDNETLHSESVVIKESICDAEDLELGGCIASSCEFEVSEIIDKVLAGLEFTAKMLVNDGNSVTIPMGRYRVDSAKRVDDKDYKKIIAYDALYDASVDVTEWYNKFFYVVATKEEPIVVGEIEDLWEHGDYNIDNSDNKAPLYGYFLNGTVPEELRDTTFLDTSDGSLYQAVEENGRYIWKVVYNCTRKTTTKCIYATGTLKQMRESLLNYLNIPFVEQTLVNDDITVTRTLDLSENGSSITGAELLKSICVINGGFGKINRDGKFEVINLGAPGLYPEETLYPSEDLYPQDTVVIGASDEFPSYRSVIYEDYDTSAITGLILKTNSEDVGSTIGTNENPYIISGNSIIYGKTNEELQKIGANILVYLRQCVYRPNTTTLEGLPYIETGDSYGVEKERDIFASYLFSRTLNGIQALKDTFEAKGNKIRANENTESNTIAQLQAKTLTIEKSVNGISVEVTDLEKNASSKFEQTAEQIQAEVTRAKASEGELSGRITITASDITAEVTRATNAEESLSSRIRLTDSSITQEVTRATNAEESLSASLTLKIDKDDNNRIVSMINASADVITLNSNRLVVNSSDFKLDQYGNATFSGKLSSPTMEGDLTIADNLSVANGKFVVNGGAGGAYASVSGYLSVTDYVNAFGHIYSADYIEAAGYIKTDKIQTRYSGDNLEILTTSGGKIKLYDSSETYGVVMDKNSSNKYHFRPGSNGALDCGSASYHWDNVYANNGSIVTSDRDEKTNIKEMSEAYANALIDGTKPKIYMMKKNNSGRTHAGMIAQDLEQQLLESGMSSQDFAGFIKYQKEDENGFMTGQFGYGIRYEEYIAPLIKYCQCLKKDLKQEVFSRQQMYLQLLVLQGEVEILKQRIGGN